MEMEIKTLMGLDMPTVVAQLDEQLEPAAYSAVPGAVDLTDIKPAWLTETMNKVFGIAGYGWWFVYNPADLVVTELVDAKGRTVYQASLSQLALYYRLMVNEVIEVAGPIYGNGYSDNFDRGYAIRGAITNALGAAASKLGWQLSVYQDKRSHRDMRTPAEVVIPFGKHKGMKLSEAPVDYVKWLAEETKNADLKAAAQAYLESIEGDNASTSGAQAPATKTDPAAAPAAKASAAPANPGDPEVTFGKYKGRKLSEVFAEDASYVSWLSENAKSENIKAAAAALIAAQPTKASAPAASAQAPANGGNGNGMTLEQALKVTLPFGTRGNPDLKDKPLGEAEKAEPAFVEFLASPKGAKYPDLHQAAKVIIGARVPVAAQAA
jgi:uncharacterized protein (DUF3820 family)